LTLVAFVAFAPVVALLVWIYLKDAYEPEPRAFVMKVALAGGALVVAAAALESLLSLWLPQSLTVESFITTGLCEELVKFGGALLVFYKSRHFNEEMDGIVYSSSLALGFAAVENVLYVTDGGLESGYVRALLPVPGHAVFGVVMGYFLAKAKFGTGRVKHENLMRALFVPATLHGIFNFLMSSSMTLALLVVPLMAALLWFCAKRMDALEELSPFSPSRRKMPENRATQG